MDTTQIRQAFDGSSELPKRIKEWRDDRLGHIMANSGPVLMKEGPCLVLHVVPMSIFSDPHRYTIAELSDKKASAPPLSASPLGGWDSRINIDGRLTILRDPREPSKAIDYAQAFRSGAIEAATKQSITRGDDGIYYLEYRYYELYILTAMDLYAKALTHLDVSVPVALTLSVIGAKGAYMNYGDFPEEFVRLDRDVLLLPEVLVDDLSQDVATMLRPLFDSVWNAFGHPRCYNYDNEGNRR